MDYVNLRLTGRAAATQSTAFPLLLVDNRELGRLEYSEELLKRAEIDPAKLPELLPLDATLGPLTSAAADDLGLAPGLPVVMGASDSITAAIATGALGPSDGTLIVGTTSVLVCHVSHKHTDVEHAILSVPSPLPGRYFVMAENGVGGRALELFLRDLVFADDAFATGPLPGDAYERAERAAASAPPGAGGVLFLPWLAGSIAPRPDENVRGGFVNLGLQTTRADLARALMEGVALNFRWLHPHVERFSGGRFASLRFAGGGALSDTWAQIHADVLGLPIEQLADARNTNARGAAFLAFERLGRLRFEDVSRLLRIRRRYEPRAETGELYERLAAAFVAFHEKSAGVFGALNAAAASRAAGGAEP
jgi:xylulokinase